MTNINLYGKNVEITEKLQKYLNKKVAAIEKLTVKDETEMSVELWDESENKAGANKYTAQINISVNGTEYHYRAEAATLEASIDLMKDGIVRDIKKDKKKAKDALRQGGRMFKKALGNA